MHEKLKQRVDLECVSQPAEGKGRVDASVTEYQPICSRMDHGTFYTIYLKLNNYEIKKDLAGKTKHRYNFNIFIQNFSGAITMGLNPNQKLIFKKEDRDPKKDPEEMLYDLSTSIDVQPFSSYNEQKDLLCVLDEPLSGKILDVHANILFPPSTIFQKNNLEQSQYIDPISYVRDGEDFYEQRAEPLNSDGSTKKLDDIFGKDIVTLLTEYDATNSSNLIGILKNVRKEGFGRPNSRVIKCYPRRVKFLH